MDRDFAIRCPLVRPRMPLIRFLFVRSRLCSTLPPDPASRRRPCASLALRLHQTVQRTFTSKLSNMPGTQRRRFAADASRGRIWQGNCDAADQLAGSNYPTGALSRGYDIASRDSADTNPIRAIPLPNQGRFLQIVVSQASNSLSRRNSSCWVACDTTLGFPLRGRRFAW